jgi:hypothetical protein
MPSGKNWDGPLDDIEAGTHIVRWAKFRGGAGSGVKDRHH